MIAIVNTIPSGSLAWKSQSLYIFHHCYSISQCVPLLRGSRKRIRPSVLPACGLICSPGFPSLVGGSGADLASLSLWKPAVTSSH
nr:hypothetical protein CFP56_21032 [Quercus suber]